MKKVLIVSAHTDIQNGSYVNRRILETVKRELPEAVIDSLSERYPDFRIDSATEQKKVVDADVIVWQFPLFWFDKPSLLQRWLEEVFTHGFTHGTNGNALQGKKLLLSITTGAPAELYAHDGRPNGGIEDLLLPAIKTTAQFTGMTLVDSLIITYGVSFDLRSDPEKARELERKADDHAARLVALLRDVAK
jgi:general stress protein 14